MYDSDTTTTCSAFPLCLSQARYRLVHTRDFSTFVEFYICTHTHIYTAIYLTHLYMCSHTHRLLLSSFVKSNVCTHTSRHRGACSFGTFKHVHSLIYTHTHTHAHSLLRRMSPKRGAQEEVQLLSRSHSPLSLCGSLPFVLQLVHIIITVVVVVCLCF